MAFGIVGLLAIIPDAPVDVAGLGLLAIIPDAPVDVAGLGLAVPLVGELVGADALAPEAPVASGAATVLPSTVRLDPQLVALAPRSVMSNVAATFVERQRYRRFIVNFR
jgi:hypothetical protein